MFSNLVDLLSTQVPTHNFLLQMVIICVKTSTLMSYELTLSEYNSFEYNPTLKVIVPNLGFIYMSADITEWCGWHTNYCYHQTAFVDIPHLHPYHKSQNWN